LLAEDQVRTTTILWMFITAFVSAAGISACSKSNNLFLGRIERTLGSHIVVVTDCYRASVPLPEESRDPVDGSTIYHFMPCGDAEITIHRERLVVNGIAYEKLEPGDTVVVDHGQVLIDTHAARRAPPNPERPSSAH
jgi:hypothetical protein